MNTEKSPRLPLQKHEEIIPAGLMASVLITLAAISLAIVGFDNSEPAIRIIFGGIGIISVLGAALLIDAIMDKLEISTVDRRKDMNFGYVIFSFTIGCIMFSLFLLYHKSVPYNNLLLEWDYSWILFLIPSTAIFFKLMIDKEKNNIVTIVSIGTTILLAVISASPLWGWFRGIQ